MKQLEIRNALPTDFDTVYDFITALENEQFDPVQLRSIFLENLQNNNIIYLVVVQNLHVVGFLSCHIQNLLHHNGLIGEIQEMFTSENDRNIGVGKLLLNALKIQAQEKGVIQLEVTSNIKREKAHHFYEKNGFKNTHKKFVLELTP